MIVINITREFAWTNICINYLNWHQSWGIIDVTKIDYSREYICSCHYFSMENFRYQICASDGFYDLLEKFMDFDHTAVVTVGTLYKAGPHLDPIRSESCAIVDPRPLQKPDPIPKYLAKNSIKTISGVLNSNMTIIFPNYRVTVKKNTKMRHFWYKIWNVFVILLCMKIYSLKNSRVFILKYHNRFFIF